MKKRYDCVSKEAEAAGLNLQQIRQVYAQNPMPFALIQLLTKSGRVTDGVFVYTNDAFAQLCSISNDTLVGRRYLSIFPEVSQSGFDTVSALTHADGTSVTHQFRDNIGRFLRVDCYQVVPGYIGCMVQDVSERHVYGSEELQAFSGIGKFVDGGVLITTLHQPHQVVYCSESLYTLMGSPSLTALQKRVREHSLYGCIHPADRETLKRLVDELAYHETMHCILRARTERESYIWLSVRSKRAVMHERDVVITMTHNITDEMVRVSREHKMIQNISAQYYATYYVNAATGIYYAMESGPVVYRVDLPASGVYTEAMVDYVHSYIHPDDRAAMLRASTVDAFLAMAQRKDGYLLHTQQFRRRFGSDYEWVEVLMSMREQADPREEQIITLAFRNIHNEKLAEMEKRYMEVFSYAVAHSYEAVLEADVNNNVLYELKLGENGLYRLPRYETDVESRIRYATLHIHPDDASRFLDEFTPDILQYTDLSHHVNYEYRRRGEDQSEYRWCVYSLRAFTQNGHRLCILFVKDTHDTKMRHLREQKRLQTAVLEAECRIHEKNSQLITYYGKTIELMSSVVEYRSLESGEHVRRIKNYTEELLRAAAALFPEQKLTAEKIQSITEASALHDVGKIGVPDNILLKPARLTPEEFEIMKQHTVIGADIALEIPCVKEREDEYCYGYDIARYHHERYDGRGYPDGLRGEEIPFCAQIVAIADVYDALTTVRVYKDAYSVDEAFEMILNGECGVFSPKMLHCFTNVRDRFAHIQQAFSEDEAVR